MARIVRVVRNVDFGRLFDSFFVSAISTILMVRFYLHLSGYPQIGNSVLHISHLLPGSVLMLIALLFLLGSVNRAVRDFSAVIGGVGFGLVLDELGKFITKNNDYFFKQTPGLIYLTLVALYLIARYSARKRFTRADYLANVLDIIKDGAIKDLDQREYQHAKELLAHVSKNHAMYRPTLNLLNSVKPSPNREPLFFGSLVNAAKAPLETFSNWRFFTRVVVSLAITYGAVSLFTAIFFFAGALNENSSRLNFAVLKGDQSDVAGGASALISAGYVLGGASRYIKGRKIKAYRFFELALLINIFAEEVLLFFKNESVAIIQLAIVLVLLVNVNILIADERQAKLKI